MGVSRRRFLGCFGSAVAVPRLFAKAPGDFDADLTVLLSDLHVNGISNSHQLGRLERAVGEILALNPLPARTVLFPPIWEAPCVRPQTDWCLPRLRRRSFPWQEAD